MKTIEDVKFKIIALNSDKELLLDNTNSEGLSKSLEFVESYNWFFYPSKLINLFLLTIIEEELREIHD